jgi:alpha-tubulin suppressor-like RCC1 family protein
MKCWGYNVYGQLGYGDTVQRGDGDREMGDYLGFVDVNSGVVSLSLGVYHTCAVLTDLTVKCWGYNGYGQLGQGDTTQRGDGSGEMGASLSTIDVGSSVLVAEIATGSYHTCVLSTDGDIKCWGYNGYGQLGYGDTTQRGDGSGEMGDSLPFVDVDTTCNVIQGLIAG